MTYFPSVSIWANDAKVARVHATASSRVKASASSCWRPRIRTTVVVSSNIAITSCSSRMNRGRCFLDMDRSDARSSIAASVLLNDGGGIATGTLTGTLGKVSNSPERRAPRRDLGMKASNGQAVYRVTHKPLISPIAPASPRSVAAPFAPLSGAAHSTGRGVDAPAGPLLPTAKGAPLQDAPLCQPQSSSSKGRRPFPLSRRQAVQTVSGLVVQALRCRRQTVCARQIVVSARYPHPIYEVNADHSAHVLCVPVAPALCRSNEEQSWSR